MPRWVRRNDAVPTVGDLVRALGGRLDGCPGSARVDDVGAIDCGLDVALAPLWDSRSVGAARDSAARVLLVDEALADAVPGRARWIHPRPRRALRGVIELLFERRDAFEGMLRAGAGGGASVHPGARVHPRAVLGPGAFVGAGAVVGEGVEVGPNAVVMHDVDIGAGSIVGPSSVVGADGFGLDAVHGETDPEAIPHVGRVEIGERVTLGALVVVARGTLGATRIRDFTRIDAHVQVGHNVVIGRGCVVSAQVGLGGSSVIGDGVWIGGQAGVADHCRVGDLARIAAQSGVIGDVPAGAVWGGTPAVEHSAWMRAAAQAHLGARSRRRGGGRR